MATGSIIGSFVRRPSLASRGLIMEQAPYPKGTGKVTKLSIILAMSARLYGLAAPEPIDCGMDGDSFATAVRVYPYDPGLDYELGVTLGVLGLPLREEVTIHEHVSFAASAEEALKYPLQELISAEWLGGASQVWSVDGAVIGAAPPTVDTDGAVKAEQALYATAMVVYRTVRFVHPLTIAAREDAVENVYQSYAWARWPGGAKLLEIKPPAGAEEDFERSVACDGGYDVNINPDGDEPRMPQAKPVDREVELDYCEDF